MILFFKFHKTFKADYKSELFFSIQITIHIKKLDSIFSFPKNI